MPVKRQIGRKPENQLVARSTLVFWMLLLLTAAGAAGAAGDAAAAAPQASCSGAPSHPHTHAHAAGAHEPTVKCYNVEHHKKCKKLLK